MSNTLIRVLAGSFLLISLAPAQANNSNFGDMAIRQINAEGFQRCKTIGRSGYTATASGTSTGGSGPGSGTFRIRTCFTSLSQCENFLERLPSIAGKVDTFWHRGCKARG